MTVGFCLGGADGLDDEIAVARKICAPDVIVAANRAGVDYECDHWVTNHPEKMPRWIMERDYRMKMPSLWTSNEKTPDAVKFNRIRPSLNGSSGLLAVQVALAMGCDKVVLCGIPLDSRSHYYDDSAWNDSRKFRAAWYEFKPFMAGRVRGLSGFTADLLGVADADWLNRKA